MFLYCNFNSLSRKIFPGRSSWQGFYILWSQGKHRVGGIRQDWSLFPVKVVGAEKMTRRSMCFIIISPQVSVRQKAAFRIQACKCDSVHPTFKSSKPQVLRVEVKHPLYERNCEAYKLLPYKEREKQTGNSQDLVWWSCAGERDPKRKSHQVSCLQVFFNHVWIEDLGNFSPTWARKGRDVEQIWQTVKFPSHSQDHRVSLQSSIVWSTLTTSKGMS